MKKLIGNSCAKGCMVYVVALLVIVVLTALGLGGLSAKMGAEAGVRSGGKPVSILTTSGAPDQSGNAGAGVEAEGQSNGSDAGNATPVAPAPAPASTPPLILPPATPVGAPAVNPPAQAPIGDISGEAISPFYIVQSGDTLWAIAGKFGVGVDTLQSANNLTDDIIKQGQLLFLPAGSGSQQAPAQAPSQAPVAPAPPAGGQAQPVPAMPQTGLPRDR